MFMRDLGAQVGFLTTSIAACSLACVLFLKTFAQFSYLGLKILKMLLVVESIFKDPVIILKKF